jgi:hypothetical protein
LTKQKKSSPTVSHRRLPFIPSWENRLRTQRSVVHPSALEEVEWYKNNFVFLRIPDLSFQEVEGYIHNFVSLRVPDVSEI